MKRKVEYYVTKSGERPFAKWFDKLAQKLQFLVANYIDRVAEGGSKKNIKPLQDGLFEIRIFYGPGIRIYFAEDGDKIILLLIGGDKRSQTADIKKAKMYWREYVQKK